MAEGQVVLNASVTAGAAVAVYTDSGTRQHQEMIVQTQSGASDPVSVSATNPMPVAGAVADLVADSGNSVKVAGVFNTAPITVANAQRAPLQVDASGFLKVNVAAGGAAGGTSSAVGAAAPSVATGIGFSDGINMRLGSVDGSGNIKVNIAAGGVPAGVDNAAFSFGVTSGLPLLGVADQVNGVSPVVQGNQGVLKMTLDRKLFSAIGATQSGGWTPFHLITLATVNATRIKATPGQVGLIHIFNSSGSPIYVKLYDKGSAAPTVGTDVPVQTYGLSANGVLNLAVSIGEAFANGIGIALTGAAADNDNTAIGAGLALNVLYA